MEDKILEILKAMQEQINSIDNKMDGMKIDIDEMKIDISDLKDCQREIKSTLGDLEATNAKRHIEMEKSINVLNENVDFITHKLNETERDMFNIKNNLKIIK